MTIHLLPDRMKLDARENLDAMVTRARSLNVFGTTVDFDAPVWDLAVTKVARPSARSAQQAKLIFATHLDNYVYDIEQRTLMTNPFASFVKAMIVLREEIKPKAAKEHDRILRTARSLYDAMADPDRDPVNLSSMDFMAACNDIRTRKTQRGKATAPTTAYRLGQGLAEIAEFVNRHSLAKVRIAFSNPFPRVTYDDTKVNEKARKERAERMATQEEMGAIVDASLAIRQRDNDRDLLRIAIVEWICCAPVRINEVLDTGADCRRTERSVRKKTGEEVEYLGYSYDGSKGANDQPKWIPTAMVPIADRALADAKRITEPFREIARWMERHPGRAYLEKPWRLADPETLLSQAEVGLALGLAKRGEREWLDAAGLRQRRRSRCRYRLGDIEAVVLSQQPKLPDPKAKLSDYMFVVPQWYFKDGATPRYCVLTIIGDSQIADFLGCKKGRPGIFEQLGILDGQNQPYRINTHSVRHFLNTLAQQGLLSQLDIARWSGRKDVRENAAYDHSDGLQQGREMRKVIEAGGMDGAVADTAASLPPIERDEFLAMRFETAHFTSIGACVQNFSVAPCPSHGSCSGCSEHLLVKGQPEHLAETERLLEEHTVMLDGARLEMNEGTYNASSWVEHNEKVVDRLKKAISVHRDPNIADGTVVQI
jgi:hypothetical protein